MKFETFFSASLVVLIYTLLSSVVLILLFSKVSLLKFTSETPISSTKKIVNKPLRWIIACLLLLIVFWFDFVRDYTFKNLNMQMNFMYALENGQQGLYNYTDSFMENLLGKATSTTIFYFKFLMTCVFSLVYFSLTTVLLKLFFTNQRVLPFTFLFYSVTFCFMGLFYIFNSFPFSFETANNFYLISMEIGHFMQSSLPTLLFIVLFKMQSKVMVAHQIPN